MIKRRPRGVSKKIITPFLYRVWRHRECKSSLVIYVRACVCVWLKRTMSRERHVVRTISIHRRDILCCGGGRKSRTVTLYIIIIYTYMHIIGALSSEGTGSGRKNVPMERTTMLYTSCRWKRTWRALKSRASRAVSIITICPKRFFSIRRDQNGGALVSSG